MGHSSLGKYGVTKGEKTCTYVLFKSKFTNLQTKSLTGTKWHNVVLEQPLKDFSSIKIPGEYEGDVICFLYRYRYKVLCKLKVD